VVEKDGISDYQGWGALLLQDLGGNWGVLSWSYGSCSVCDGYEDVFYCYGKYDEDSPDPIPDRGSPRHCAEVFGGNIEPAPSEDEARTVFSSRKGW
jgi:hypothetical protein